MQLAQLQEPLREVPRELQAEPVTAADVAALVARAEAVQ